MIYTPLPETDTLAKLQQLLAQADNASVRIVTQLLLAAIGETRMAQPGVNGDQSMRDEESPVRGGLQESRSMQPMRYCWASHAA